MDEQYDSEEIYCRKLGHHLTFKYCRMEREGFPCSRVFECWFEKIPIEEFILKNYSKSEIDLIMAPPSQKLAALTELVARIKNRNE